MLQVNHLVRYIVNIKFIAVVKQLSRENKIFKYMMNFVNTWICNFHVTLRYYGELNSILLEYTISISYLCLTSYLTFFVHLKEYMYSRGQN